VTVTKSGSTLIITGDSAANDVFVAGTGTPGEYAVAGVDADASGDDTLLNGDLHDLGDPLIFEGIRNIVVNLGGGNDIFGLSNVEFFEDPDDLVNVTVNTAAGNDLVLLGGPVDASSLEGLGFDSGVASDLAAASGPVSLQGNLLVNTGNNDDRIFATDVSSGGNQTYLFGAGDDDLISDSLSARNLKADFAAGRPMFSSVGLIETALDMTVLACNGVNSFAEVYIESLDVGRNLKIATGAGGAEISLYDGGDVGLNACITTGNAANRAAGIYLNGIDVDNLAKIVTGHGNDDVELYNVSTKLLTIITCSGNDVVEIGVGIGGGDETPSDVAHKAVIDTGKGKDHVHIGTGDTDEVGGTAFDYLTVLLGVNQDCLAIGNTLVRKHTLLNGGLAEDNFDDNYGNEFLGKYKLACFEYFEDCEEEEEYDPE
jgi:hypothetical protein